MEPFLGQLMMVGFNFAPRGWALCDGQRMQQNQNTALHSLIGTTYGSDNQDPNIFFLPDMRGRVAVHPDNRNNTTTPYRQGEHIGAQFVTLRTAQMPAHAHTHGHVLQAVDGAAEETSPLNNILAIDTDSGAKIYHPGWVGKVAMASEAIADDTTSVGGTDNIQVLQPSLGIYFIIAIVGIYPSR